MNSRVFGFQEGDVATDRVGKSLAYPEFSARLWAEVKLLESAVGTKRALNSLEIGCGYGRLTPWISAFSDVHYAIEPERKLLASAEKLYPWVTFRQAKAEAIPFPDRTFDLVVSWTVLQHIKPKIILACVDEIKRVSSEDAVLVIAEGVGRGKVRGYWERTSSEWNDLLSPWKLSWSTPRRLETTYSGEAGQIMRFERD